MVILIRPKSILRHYEFILSKICIFGRTFEIAYAWTLKLVLKLVSRPRVIENIIKIIYDIDFTYMH